MNWSAISFDWNQVRASLATVEEGSLSAAARATGLAQPTLGRQVAALEEALGVVLFERVGRSLTLTASGAELLEHVRAMGEAANRLSLSASGQSQRIDGLVRISASDVTAAYHLPPIIAQIRDIAPGIEIEVVAANDLSDLQRRDADIALRHVRPEAPELYARKLRDEVAYFYGTPDYFDRMGRPSSRNDLGHHSFLCYGAPEQMLQHFRGMKLDVSRENCRYYSENGVAAWQMVCAGLGIGIMSESIGRAAPEVVPVLQNDVAVSFSTWLVSHRELQTSPRIRLVFDALARAFGA